jgi:hypothetical protein
MNTRGKNWIASTWATIIKNLCFSSSLTPTIPLPEKNKCYEIPVSPAKNSGDNNITNCVAQEEPTVSQEANLNVAINNEPAKCNLRASRLKKPFDNKDDFLWY